MYIIVQIAVIVVMCSELPGVAETTHVEPTRPLPAVETTQRLLDQLPVEPEHEFGYERSKFVHWVDANSDGCDTRCEVLRAQRVERLDGLQHGGWLSIYDGYTTDDDSELDIDHVVSLKEAWESGAWNWSDRKRRDYANDVNGLQAVSAASNRSKSDKDAALWQPSNRGAVCWFTQKTVEVKSDWGLSIDRAEKTALTNLLASCGH